MRRARSAPAPHPLPPVPGPTGRTKYRLPRGAAPVPVFLILACVVACAQTNPQNPSVTVDFSRPVSGVVSQAGFVGGVDPSSPPYANIGPLKPNLWTISGVYPFNDPAPPSQSYGRARQFTNRLLFTVGDLWGYPNSSATPPPSEYPYQDWTKWQSVVQQAAQANAGRNLMWAVWNEPDSSLTWPGTQQQFFDTYAHAYPMLRQALGASALIGGPQISAYDHNYIAAFLEYALANNLQVNFLAWHEIPSADTGIAAIPADVQDARAFLQNPRYASLNIQKIFIDRSVGVSSNHKPGDVLGYLYYLEQAHPDGAAKACWQDSHQSSECFNDTVDGVITTQFQPRGVWWAYKAYADGVATRVVSSTTDYRVVALASSSGVSANTAQVLAGYFNSAGAAASGVPINVNLNNLGSLAFLQGATQVRIATELIPASDEAPVDQLTIATDSVMPIQSGSAQVNIPFVRPGEAYRVTISAPANGAAPAPSSIVNAASFASQALAPGSIVTIWGANFTTQTLQPGSFPLPTTFGGVTVIANDIAMPLLYVSPNQINAQLPYSMAMGNATLVVRSGPNVSAPMPFTVTAASPGIFVTPTGSAIAVNQDGSLNIMRGAPVGSVISVYMTGQGAVDNPVPDGTAAPLTPLSRATLPASVTVGGLPATFQFLGLAPGYAGILQANVVIPSGAPGVSQIVITIAGVPSNVANIQVN
jgi:xylan 1,4-beta-xylosidase